MGNRTSSVKNRKAGVSGDGVAIRLPNNATVRSARRHIPLYVGICVQPYCGQHRWARRHKTSDRKKTKAPRERGLKGEGGPLSLELQQRRNLFPSKTETAECEAFPPSPNGARPALRLPPVPTGMW